MKPGKISFELGVGLGRPADRFLYLVAMSDHGESGAQNGECFVGDRDLPRYQGRP